MATRGIRVLFLLPLLTALLAGSAWFAGAYEESNPFVISSPDHQIDRVLIEINAGQTAGITRYMTGAAAKIDLYELHLRLQQRYGAMVSTRAEIRELTANHAVVWSWTRTAPGHLYLISWQMVPYHGYWLVYRVDGLKEIAPDVPGV